MLLIINSFQFLGFQILHPILPVYSLEFTHSETLIGIMSASIALSSIFTRPVSALLADKGDRKRIVIFAQFAYAGAGFILLFCRNIYQLIAVRLIQGIVFSITSTTANTSAISMLPESKLGHGVGLFSLSYIVTQGIAPGLGIFVSGKYGYAVFFIFVAMLSVISGILALFLKDTPGSKITKDLIKKVSFRSIFASETFKLIFILLFFACITSIINNFLLLYGNTIGLGGIGHFFVIYAGVLILVRMVGGILIDRLYYGVIVLFCTGLCAAASLIIANAQSFLYLVIAAILLGFGYGYSNPALQAEMVRRVPGDRIGGATATFYFSLDLANIIAPVIMGFLIENIGYQMGYSLFCLPLVIGIIIVFAEKRQ